MRVVQLVGLMDCLLAASWAALLVCLLAGVRAKMWAIQLGSWKGDSTEVRLELKLAGRVALWWVRCWVELTAWRLVARRELQKDAQWAPPLVAL